MTTIVTGGLRKEFLVRLKIKIVLHLHHSVSWECINNVSNSHNVRVYQCNHTRCAPKGICAIINVYHLLELLRKYIYDEIQGIYGN